MKTVLQEKPTETSQVAPPLAATTDPVIFFRNNLKSLGLGALFGIVLLKSEVVSWFRIQEMFRFQSFHMYGVLMSAAGVGALSLWLIRRFQARTIYGEPVFIPFKPLTKGSLFGGIAFGLGWAMTGACPGPIYALIGGGYWAMAAVLAGALAGSFVYGLLRPRLPH